MVKQRVDGRRVESLERIQRDIAEFCDNLRVSITIAASYIYEDDRIKDK